MVMIKVNGEGSKLNLHSGTNTNTTSMVNITTTSMVNTNTNSMVNITTTSMVNTNTTGELNVKTGDSSTEVVSQPRKATSANETNIKGSISSGLSTREQVKIFTLYHLVTFQLPQIWIFSWTRNTGHQPNTKDQLNKKYRDGKLRRRILC